MQCVLLIWTDIISMYQAYEVEFFLKEEEENKEKGKENRRQQKCQQDWKNDLVCSE